MATSLSTTGKSRRRSHSGEDYEGRRRGRNNRRSNMEVDYGGQPRYYKYGVRAPHWTLWTDDNPGRRFYGCPYYEVS